MPILFRLVTRWIHAGLLIVCTLILNHSAAFALDDTQPFSRYERQSWQVENGLPQDTVHAVLQTHDGYLWLATEGGAVRFDGLQFAKFDSQNTPQFPSNDIRTLFEDPSGVLWFGTPDGLVRLQNSTWTTFTTASGLPSNNIYGICGDHDGRLLVVTPEGFAQYQAGHFAAFPMPGSTSLNAIAPDRNGTIWLGTQSGLKLLSNGRVTKPNLPSPLADGAINTLLAARDGRLWAGTAAGVMVYDGQHVKTYTKQDGLPGNRVTTLYEDRQSVIWLGTDGGLARIAGGQVMSLPKTDPLASSIILSIFEDHEGDLWLGTESQGLVVLRDTKFVTYTARDGLPSDFVRCVFEDQNGTIWIGTNTGLSVWADGHFSTLTTADGLSSNIIFALADDRDGHLLVGTPDGLNILEHGHVRVLTSADGLADDFVRSIYRDNDGSIWIGTRRGLSHWKNGHFQTYTQSDGLASDFVGALLRDKQGVLFIGTLGGLSKFQDGRFVNFTTKNGLASNIVTVLHEDRDGNLWIGTQGGGLHRWHNGSIVRFESKFDLPTTIFGILEDALDHLWLASRSGIYRVSRGALNRYADGQATSVDSVWYGAADGLRVNECTGGGHPAAWKTRNGQLWFSTLKGASVFDNRHAKLNRLPPPVVIESVSVDGRKRNPAQPLDLPPGVSRLVFEYAGLSFAAPAKVRFKYKLEGFDHDWIDADTQRTAYYTNIPPGRYSFHVIARNSDGYWNTAGASVSLRLEPHFYETYWFYVLIAFALAALGYGIYRYRVHQVQSRFDAVLAERNRIAREIHDTLAQGFVAVSVQLEVVSRLLSISSEAAEEQLQRARDLVRDGLQEARRSIWELRSQGSTQDDFAARLSKAATRIIATAPLKWNLQVNGTYHPLPPKTEDELIRIASEAITNTVRHAHAKHVEANLLFEPKKFRMIIRDDGVGFDGQPVSVGTAGHFGLKGMRERAESIGAKLSVDSERLKGTTVAVEVPIN